MKAIALTCLILGTLTGLVLAQRPVSGGDPSDLIPPEPQYVIQPSDVLELFVWKEPELSRKVTVRPDGRISFPLVKEIEASGMTALELTAEIEKRLQEYIAEPNVTIIVDSIQHYKVFVIGKVQNPGAYISESPLSVLQALTLAGGFQDYADTSDITIVRTYGREHVVFHFNYGDVSNGKNTHQNITLRAGDVIIVP